MSIHRTLATNLVNAAILLAACGAQSSGRRPAAAPRAYDGTCVLAGIEQVPAPVGQNEDSVVMVARYRPSNGAHGGAGGWSLRFQVERARERDLRLHIEGHSRVLCDVDSDTAAPTSARIDLPPFQGQRGTVDQ